MEHPLRHKLVVTIPQLVREVIQETLIHMEIVAEEILTPQDGLVVMVLVEVVEVVALLAALTAALQMAPRLVLLAVPRAILTVALLVVPRRVLLVVPPVALQVAPLVAPLVALVVPPAPLMIPHIEA